MTDLLIRLRFWTFGAVSVLMVVLFLWGRHVQYEQSIQSFFADEDPAVISYRKAATLFGNDQLVFLVYDDPDLLTAAGMDRVAELASMVGPDKIDGVTRVESLEGMPALWKVEENFLALNKVDERLAKMGNSLLARGIRSTRDQLWERLKKSVAGSGRILGDMSVGAQVRQADDDDLPAMRERILKNPFYMGTVVDPTGKTTAVVARLKAPEEHDVKVAIAALRTAAAEFAGRHGTKTPAVVGPPVLLADGFTAIEIDGRRLALAGMALIGLVMFSGTRSLWWALVPAVAGWSVWLATDTVLSLLDIRLSLSGGPLVAQIIVLTMPAASHLALHFIDDLRQGKDRNEAARETLNSVSGPIVWCVVAGMIGYGALVTSNVVPVRQFGAVLAICTAAGSLLTLLLSPIAMLPPMPLEWPVRQGSRSLTATAMNRLTAWVVKRPGLLTLVMLASVGPLSWGISRLEYESNYINAFKPRAPVVRDYYEAERKLGGIGLISVLLPVGTTFDHETLAKLAEFERDARSMKARPGEPQPITQAISPATVLDPEGQVAALDEAAQDRILKAKLELISASSLVELLNGFWRPDEGATRVMVRLLEGQQAATKQATFDVLRVKGRALFGPGADVTGLSYLLTLTTAGVIATQWNTFFWSIGGLLVVLTLAFRGPRLAILAILPTLLAVVMVLGLMGWLGVKLDIATALVGSVALGLSVDDTFHCLLQFRRARAEHPFREALFRSYSVSGPGVLLSSLAVAVGFSVLRFSEFVPFSNFGSMVAIATLGSSLGNVALLPAMLALGNRLGSRSKPTT